VSVYGNGGRLPSFSIAGRIEDTINAKDKGLSLNQAELDKRKADLRPVLLNIQHTFQFPLKELTTPYGSLQKFCYHLDYQGIYSSRGPLFRAKLMAWVKKVSFLKHDIDVTLQYIHVYHLMMDLLLVLSPNPEQQIPDISKKEALDVALGLAPSANKKHMLR
jgi:hypothetical protein